MTGQYKLHINAMEMTSSQIIETLHRNEETKAVNRQLRDILEMADFVKFAKMRPLPDDNEQVMRYAETFVEETNRKKRLLNPRIRLPKKRNEKRC